MRKKIIDININSKRGKIIKKEPRLDTFRFINILKIDFPEQKDQL